MYNMEVTGCGTCPFRDEIEQEIRGSGDPDDEPYYETYTQYYCKHPKRYLVNLYENDDGIVTPGDCPLLKEPTTITLKEDTNEIL